MSLGGGDSQTSRSISEPWAPQQPFLTRGFTEAGKLYDRGPQQYYPGQTYANFSPETQQAHSMQSQRAIQGSPAVNAAQGQIADTAGGSYLNSNPYLDRMFGNASDAVTRQYREATAPSIGSQFALAGRAGSGQHANALNQSQDQLGRTLSGMAADIYGGNYNQERGRQIQASALAPSLANQDYQDIGQLADVGMQKERLAEQGIGENIARYNYGQQAPYDALARFQQMIQGNYGGTNTQTSPLYRNYGAGALGGGLAGAGISRMSGGSIDPLLGILGGGLLGGIF